MKLHHFLQLNKRKRKGNINYERKQSSSWRSDRSCVYLLSRFYRVFGRGVAEDQSTGHETDAVIFENFQHLCLLTDRSCPDELLRNGTRLITIKVGYLLVVLTLQYWRPASQISILSYRNEEKGSYQIPTYVEWNLSQRSREISDVL